MALAPLTPALLRSLQHDSSSRALYGVLAAAHAGIARHGAAAIAQAAPALHTALPRLMTDYVLSCGPPQQTLRASQSEGTGSGTEQGFEAVLRLLAAAPALLAPLLDYLAAAAAPGSASSASDAPASVTLQNGLAIGRCLSQVLADDELRLQVIGAESNVMRLLDALTEVPCDDAASAGQELRHLCSSLRHSAMDAFGRRALQAAP